MTVFNHYASEQEKFIFKMCKKPLVKQKLEIDECFIDRHNKLVIYSSNFGAVVLDSEEIIASWVDAIKEIQ